MKPNIRNTAVQRGLSVLLIFILFLSNSLMAQAAPAVPGEPQGPIAGLVQLPPEARTAPILLLAEPGSTHGKLDAQLAELATLAGRSMPAALDLADARGLRRMGELIQVQVVTTPERLPAAQRAMQAAGGQVTGAGWGDTLIQGWLPAAALQTLAEHPQVDYLRLPEQVTVHEQDAGTYTTEGLAAMNGSAWQSAGYRGAGVKVAVIDGGFQGYTGLLGSDLPASVTVKNFVDGETDAQVNGTTPHGTACAEIVHDIAPQATLYLGKVGTNIDLQEAVAWAKSMGVDVISTSLGWYNLTPGDGTGFFANLVQDARANGIFWLTAAGNDRENHWGGTFTDTDGDGYHEFADSQEVNYFGPGDGDAYYINPGYGMRVFLRWDDWSAVNQDYDLYLLRWNGSAWQQVYASTNRQTGGGGQTPTELGYYTTSGSATAYGFVIKRYSSSRNVNLEVFAPKFPRLDRTVYARSLGNLADSPDAMTVAALDATSPYPQEIYSSEGPTNGPGGTLAGGFTKPDISGFANVSTVSYGTSSKFNGTSAATPHVAGAAALVLTAYSSYTPDQIEAFLQGRAVDMGAGGMDSVYGYGRVYLGAPPTSNTAPTLQGLPDQFVPVNTTKDNAIDLWAYATDGESPDSSLVFSINNTPTAGVTLDSNRYVDINPTAGWTGQTNVEIKVTDPGGLFSTDTFQVTVFDGKLWNGSASSDWHTAANWTPSGVPAASDNVTIPDVANDPVISTADAATNNLMVSAGAWLDLTTRTLTVEGTLTNNGTLKQTKTVNAGSTTSFLLITDQTQSAIKYEALDIAPSSAGLVAEQAFAASLAPSAVNVSVEVMGNQFCAGRSSGVKRCYKVTPSGAMTASLRFYFPEAERNGMTLSELVPLRYSTQWTQITDAVTRGGSGNAQYVQVANLSTFSLFALDRYKSPFVYLPVIHKPVDKRPSAGFWTGPGVDFYVTSDRNYVHNFAVYINVSGCGSYKITRTTDAYISNNQFSFTGSFYASGTFSSSTSASGTGGFSSFYISGCGTISGPFTWSATWQHAALAQPGSPPAVIWLDGTPVVVKPFIAEPDVK